MAFNLHKLETLKSKFKSIYQFVLNKWYFDELYNKIFVNPIYDLGKFLWSKIDQGFIDRFLPNGSASVVSSIAKACKRLQSGFIFDYTFIIITGFYIIYNNYFLYISFIK